MHEIRTSALEEKEQLVKQVSVLSDMLVAVVIGGTREKIEIYFLPQKFAVNIGSHRVIVLNYFRMKRKPSTAHLYRRYIAILLSDYLLFQQAYEEHDTQILWYDFLWTAMLYHSSLLFNPNSL